MNELDLQFARTMSIVRQLAKGKQLTLSDRIKLGMGEKMEVGFVIRWHDGHETIADDLSLRQLNELLEEYGIGIAIPEREGR